MDRNYVSDNQIVDRYLRDDLTDEERVAFEEFYLSDQETLAELELAEKLKLGLQECAAQGLLEREVRPGWLRRVVTSPQWAAAATILLVFSLGYSGFLQRQLQTDTIVAGTQLVPLIATRGAESARVSPGDPDNWVVLLVDPGFESYDDYRATIVDIGSGDIVWEVAGLQPGYEDLLAVGVAGSVLQPGQYELNVEARSGSIDFVEISRIPIEVP